LWVASNVNAERVWGGLENNTKSAVNAKQALPAAAAKGVGWLVLFGKQVV
jgi:hypothetical protein